MIMSGIRMGTSRQILNRTGLEFLHFGVVLQKPIPAALTYRMARHEDLHMHNRSQELSGSFR